ncbi:hypothetical protein IOC57_06450 [Bacillus sp. SD075]|uniref:hypothetical protein n=1 Tax=Bacillus sp. SD075 TaxID=2781732 RepID=UPI001A965F05|nr:hypothetical protein [Bacillus sp. SD075]MBO0997392.1 hypothetical protein [Bacillus sp. SD075]
MEVINEPNNLLIKKGKKHTKLIIISIVGVLITLGIVMGWMKYQQNKKEEYANILAETSVDMYYEFLMSSMVLASYSNVWEKAIDDGRDFNVALVSFRDDISNKGIIEETEKGQDKIRGNMKLLQNPPKEYMESYIVLKQMYGSYSKMVDQTFSPSGSLIDFNRKTNDLYSQFEQQQEELTITLPADIKKLKKKYEKEKKKEDSESKL